MRTKQIKVVKVLPIARKNSESQNHSQRQQFSSSQQGNSSSKKKGNNNKKDKLFCAYIKKPNHDENHCKTKRIDELENLHKFLSFKSHVEKQSSKYINVLCMDNERRYVNSILRDFCELEGIYL